MVRNKMENLYVYTKKNGIKKLSIRIYEKLTHKEERMYAKWTAVNKLSIEDINNQKEKQFENEPKISIVIPLYKTPEKYLREVVESVIKQTYSNWELCLSDGSGSKSPLIELLKEFSSKDERIKYISSKKEMKISENTNQGLSIATGEYIAFVDHDDLLEINALYECIKLINTMNNKVDIIYSDEDKVSMDGKKYFQPHFKPDFNVDLLQSVNYFCHLVVVNKELIKKVGGLNEEFDGAQDYDFVLRCIENTNKIYHIPKILYHWRAHLDSTAENPESKTYAFEAGQRAVQEHYVRSGYTNVKVCRTNYQGIYRSIYKIVDEPKITIIIYNVKRRCYLDKCLKSIKEQNYNNYEIIIVKKENDHSLNMNEIKAMFKEKMKVINVSKEWSGSKQKNIAVREVESEYVLFFDANCELVGRDSIREMLGLCMRKNTGVVGCKICYRKKLLEHAGVVIGIGTFAENVFKNKYITEDTYFNRAETQMDYSAVSGLCFMVKKRILKEIKGFDENIKGNYDAIDLCLKIGRLKKLIVYTPYAKVYHLKKNIIKNKKSDVERLKCRWKEILDTGDPYYNENLSTKYADYQIK